MHVLACIALLAFPLHATADLDARQLRLLTTKCVQCHAVPDTGAPQMGWPEQWQAVLERGEETALINVVQGIRGMPPLGYCSACSEEDLRALTRFVAGFPPPEQEIN